MAGLFLSRRARRDLLDLDWPHIDAIEDALAFLAGDPEAGHELHGRLKGLSSYRVGSYRIIYQVIDRGRSVRVAAIRHRSVAYQSDPR